MFFVVICYNGWEKHSPIIKFTVYLFYLGTECFMTEVTHLRRNWCSHKCFHAVIMITYFSCDHVNGLLSITFNPQQNPWFYILQCFCLLIERGWSFICLHLPKFPFWSFFGSSSPTHMTHFVLKSNPGSIDPRVHRRSSFEPNASDSALVSPFFWAN